MFSLGDLGPKVLPWTLWGLLPIHRLVKVMGQCLLRTRKVYKLLSSGDADGRASPAGGCGKESPRRENRYLLLSLTVPPRGARGASRRISWARANLVYLVDGDAP